MIDANLPPMLIEWLYAGIVQKLVVVVTSVDTNQVSFTIRCASRISHRRAD
jgi:hypothetical protein